MAFVTPEYTRSQVNRAGLILADPLSYSEDEQEWAADVLDNWRASHGYPINTFQATLRSRLKNRYGRAIVAQRLKRAPSVIAKLRRFPGMCLARMQDIGGLRAVVGSISQVRRLEREYRDSRFGHGLANSKDYIAEPKPDGYRSVHLIYRYENRRAPAYNGLFLELQIRTQLQHAWATAVETMGTFLGQALKAGEGESRWRDFFVKASAAIALIEQAPPVTGFESKGRHEVFTQVARAEQELRVLDKLQGFAIAANEIRTERGQGAYHLIVLDARNRTLTIRPYPRSRLAEATAAYSEVEELTNAGEPVEAVLVAAGPITALRRAYPNYFLDTRDFVLQMKRVIREAERES